MTKQGKIILIAGTALVAALGVTQVVQAQTAPVSAALADGTVGEKADGYLGIRGSVAANVRAEVESINIKRRAAYTQRAASRGVSVEAVAAATGCKTLSGVAAGRAYQLDDGVWRVRGAGDPAPVPGNCPAV